MRYGILRSVLTISAVGMLGAWAAPAQADTLYQSGFESPTYSVGGLNGQDGWFNAAPAATVQTSTVFAGSQAASVSAAGVSGQSTPFHAVTYNSVGNSETQVDITGEFFLSTTGTGTNWDVAAVFGNAGFIGQLAVNNSSFVELGLASTAVGNVPVSRGVWNSFDMHLDYTTDIQSAYVNGIFVGQGAFAHASTTLSLYDFGVNSSPGTDTFSLDDLSITSSAVPIPSSAVAGIALIAGLAVTQAARRRKPVEA